MIKIAYVYTKNISFLANLKEYDVTLLTRQEYISKELFELNMPIKNINYSTDYYDIVIYDSDRIVKVKGNKKVCLEETTSKVDLISTDINEILKPKEKIDKKFSIVVPNYNNGGWINKTIESVINQTYKKWEMYVVDDISTDDSLKVIKNYKDERIDLTVNDIKLYNGGSRNVGILKSKKSNPDGYLLFIDSDDWLADNNVLEDLNEFIDNEDLITLGYRYFIGNKETQNCYHRWQDKFQLFKAETGSCCAVWCKCFKVDKAPLFEFNTLMEDRNYHYRLVNKCDNIVNFERVTHIWNKMNTKSITTDKEQLYDSLLQPKIEWDNCAYRHIAGMLDLLNELKDKDYIEYIKQKISKCKEQCNRGVYQQL